MTVLRFAAIVEGHGDVQAIPVLIRRIARNTEPELNVKVDPVIRVPGAALRKPHELERQVERAARKIGGQGAILILLDCDWDGGCPATDGPALLERARKTRGDMPIAVVLAKKEYEAWFIAAAESLAGRRGLSTDITRADAPEEIRGAKEWLSKHMPAGSPYAETTDQPALTDLFDMQAARRADSFDKCYREIAALVARLDQERRAESV